MSAIANRLPMMVVARLLGLPDEDVDNLIRLGYATTTLLDGIVSPAQLEAAGAAVMELSGYVLEHFAKAGESPQPDSIGDLAARYKSGELEQLPALTIMLTLFSAAGESTASLLGSAAWILASHRHRRTGPRPSRTAGRVHRRDAALRVALSRPLPPCRERHHAGRRRCACRFTPAADVGGRQPRSPAIRHTQRFWLDRSGAKGHVTFGKGAHFCVGAALGNVEAQIVLRTLLEQTEWISAAHVGQWLPSILVRRLERLQLSIR